MGRIGEYLDLLQKGYGWAAAHQDKWTELVARDFGVPLDYVRDQFAHCSVTYDLRPISHEAIAGQQSVADVVRI